MHGALDLFLSDMLDVPLAQEAHAVAVALGVLDKEKLQLGRLLSLPRVRAGLAFHAAFREATQGIPPARTDIARFHVLIEAGTPAADAMQALLLKAAPCLRLKALHDVHVPPAIAKYKSCLEELGRGPGSARRVASSLIAKVAQRVGAESPAVVDPARLLVTYSALFCCAEAGALLCECERWGGQASSTGVKDVVGYYERAGAAVRRARLLDRDPISGAAVRPEHEDATMACLEATWRVLAAASGPHVMNRAKGAGMLVMLRPGEPLHRRLADELKGRGRVCEDARAPPSLLRHCAPGALFDRVVREHGGEIQGGWWIAERTTATTVDLRRSDNPLGGYAVPRDMVECFGGGAGAGVWGPAVAADLLADAAMMPKERDRGEQAMRQFAVAYASVRRLGRRVFDWVCSGSDSGCEGEVVLVDTRRNPWSVLSMLMALDNVRSEQAERWGACVFTSAAALPFYEAALRPHVPAVRFELVQGADPAGAAACRAMDTDGYSELLKDADAFWGRVQARRVLVVQDDGLLIRPIASLPADYKAALKAAAYVGAPWADVASNEALKKSEAPGLVGNGGLSLRDVEFAKRTCRAAAADGSSTRLFNHDLLVVPEDVFFASAAERAGLVAPCKVAEAFSFEQRAPDPLGPRPVGMHKPWPYLPAGVFEAELAAALRDARARND